MSEEAMILHGSPTLAGLKTGSLFRYSYRSEEEMRASLRYWNRVFLSKGLRVIPLTFRSNKALLYLFRPAKLRKDLCNDVACRILSERGYCTESPQRCIRCLMQRLNECDEFPHEIGLFLGYPAEDVCAFMEHRECDLKCIGCWKVYGDEAAAQKTFAKFRKCNEIYRRCWKNGTSIERLAVSQQTESRKGESK